MIAFASVPVGDVARAAVQVDGVTVAIVDSSGSDEIEGVTAAPDADPPVEAKSKVQAIIDALGKDNVAACQSPGWSTSSGARGAIQTKLADGWRFSLEKLSVDC